MAHLSLGTAIAAVAVLLATALFTAPRLRARVRAESGARALSVLAVGLSIAAVLTVVALGTHLLA